MGEEAAPGLVLWRGKGRSGNRERQKKTEALRGRDGDSERQRELELRTPGLRSGFDPPYHDPSHVTVRLGVRVRVSTRKLFERPGPGTPAGAGGRLGLGSGFDPPDLDRPGRQLHQQGLCEARLGYQDESPQLGPLGLELERSCKLCRHCMYTPGKQRRQCGAQHAKDEVGGMEDAPGLVV